MPYSDAFGCHTCLVEPLDRRYPVSMRLVHLEVRLVYPSNSHVAMYSLSMHTEIATYLFLS